MVKPQAHAQKITGRPTRKGCSFTEPTAQGTSPQLDQLVTLQVNVPFLQ